MTCTLIWPGYSSSASTLRATSRASWEAWAQLPQCVATGNCSTVREHELSGAALRNFILGMDNVASFAAPEVLRAVDLSRYTSMLDLAGGNKRAESISMNYSGMGDGGGMVEDFQSNSAEEALVPPVLNFAKRES